MTFRPVSPTVRARAPRRTASLRRATAAAVTLCACALPFVVPTRAGAAPPTAEDREAAKAFVEGQRAFTAGDFRRAASAFETAYARKPHHASLWNAARSWQKAGEDLRAVNLLERYLHEAPPDAPDRDSATAALADVGKRVGRVELHFVGVDEGRLDGEITTVTKVYVAPGEHVMSGSAAGKPVRKVFTVESGQLLSVTLAAPDDKQAAVASPPPPTKAHGLPPWTVAVGGGLVIASGVLSGVSGFDTVDKRDAFLDDPTQPRLDDAFASQTRTNVLLGTTAGVALVTAVIAAFFVDWKAEARTGQALPGAGRNRGWRGALQ